MAELSDLLKSVDFEIKKTISDPTKWNPEPDKILDALDQLADKTATATPYFIFVDAINGSNSNLGTVNTPFQTLQYALDYFISDIQRPCTIWVMSEIPITDSFITDFSSYPAQDVPALEIRNIFSKSTPFLSREERRESRMLNAIKCDFIVDTSASLKVFEISLHNVELTKTIVIAGGSSRGDSYGDFIFKSSHTTDFSILFLDNVFGTYKHSFTSVTSELSSLKFFSKDSVFYNTNSDASTMNISDSEMNLSDTLININFNGSVNRHVTYYHYLSGTSFFSRDTIGETKLFLSKTTSDAGEYQHFLLNGGRFGLFGTLANGSISVYNTLKGQLGASFDILNGSSLDLYSSSMDGSILNNGTITLENSTLLGPLIGDGKLIGYNSLTGLKSITATTINSLNDKNIEFDATSAAITYTLQPLANYQANEILEFYKLPAVNDVTIAPDGVELIEGAASIVLQDYDHLRLINKGTFWGVIS